MDEVKNDHPEPAPVGGIDIRSLVKQAIEEFNAKEQARTEPAYKVELVEERARREELERRLNELVAENQRARQRAEEAERKTQIRSELQRLGVQKVDLAFKAVRDEIVRTAEGRLVAKTEQGEVDWKDYLAGFVTANPEFLPARIGGGSGVTGGQRAPMPPPTPVDLDRIRPGMSREEMERVRQEIVRIASQTLRGQ